MLGCGSGPASVAGPRKRPHSSAAPNLRLEPGSNPYPPYFFLPGGGVSPLTFGV